jgi:hypothetical protein
VNKYGSQPSQLGFQHGYGCQLYEIYGKVCPFDSIIPFLLFFLILVKDPTHVLTPVPTLEALRKVTVQLGSRKSLRAVSPADALMFCREHLLLRFAETIRTLTEGEYSGMHTLLLAQHEELDSS